MSLRLEKARNLLRQTDMNVTQISVLCGFANPTHFSRSYRKAYGVAPQQRRGADALLWGRDMKDINVAIRFELDGK